eukprot:3305788-Amphidinium_carterae.2
MALSTICPVPLLTLPACANICTCHSSIDHAHINEKMRNQHVCVHAYTQGHTITAYKSDTRLITTCVLSWCTKEHNDHGCSLAAPLLGGSSRMPCQLASDEHYVIPTDFNTAKNKIPLQF